MPESGAAQAIMVPETYIADIEAARANAEAELAGRAALESRGLTEFADAYYRFEMDDGRVFEGNGAEFVGLCPHIGRLGVKAQRAVLDDEETRIQRPDRETVPYSNLA